MSESVKMCELYEGKVCNGCNECNICDLDPNKICDSCGKCIGMEGDEETYSTDFLEIKIDGILDDEIEADDYVLEEGSLDAALAKILGDESCSDDEIEMEYIEDIPELKKEYDRKIYEILHKKGRGV